MKALLCCPKAKPWLHKDPFKGVYVLTEQKDIRGGKLCQNGYVFKDSGGIFKGEKEGIGPVLNGTICAECEINEVEEIKKEYHLGDRHFTYYTNTLENDELIDKSCVGKEEFCGYMPRYVLYLSNLKEIKPISVKKIYLGKAPQNMRYVLWHASRTRKGELVVLISIRPEDMCKILNGEKTIEVRQIIAKKLKELIK